MDPASLFGELKRRRVIRALVGYGIASFAVLQVSEPVIHALHLPEWTLSFMVVALGAGFPIVVVLAWAFDVSSSGVERTAPSRVHPPALSRAESAKAGAVEGPVVRAWAAAR